MRKLAITAVLLALFCAPLAAQKIKQMEFRDQKITDILLVLAELAGKSIVTDETVTGTASFFFTETDFEIALQSFLSANNLYLKKAGDIYYVSRIRVDWDKTAGLVTVDAEDVDAQLVLRALSRAIERTILYDSLPRMTVSIHAVRVKPESVIELAIRRFADFKLVVEKDYFYVRKSESAAVPGSPGAASSAVTGIKHEGGKFSIDLAKGKLLDVLVDLFARRGAEYSLMMRTDVIVENLRFRDKEFDELLRLVLEQANGDFVVYSGVYYLFEIQRKDVLKKLKQTVVVPLVYMSSQDMMSLLPPDLASSALIKADKVGNSLLVTGSPAEIDPILSFVRAMDRAPAGRVLVRYDAKFLKAKELVALLPARFAAFPPVLAADGWGIVFWVPEEAKKDLLDFLALVDRKGDAVPIKLRYIKAEELLKTLPPSVTKDDVVESGVPSLVFYVGPRDKLDRFLKELELVDRPKPLIEFDIVVIKRNSGPERDIGVSFAPREAVESEPKDGSWAITGNFTNLVNIGFDFFSAVGTVLSARLNLAFKDKSSELYAQTTIVALSGQDAKFENKETWRKLTETKDSEGKVISSVINTFESGLTISINGWISGDGMITITVNVSVSKNTDTGTDEKSLPASLSSSTQTTLRVQSGQAITLTGFLLRESTLNLVKIPLLGDLPLIGWLFSKETRTENESVLTVYIIPRIVMPEDDDITAGMEMERLYTEYAVTSR